MQNRKNLGAQPTAEQMAQTGLAITKKLVGNSMLSTTSAGELALMGQGQSEMITLSLKNNDLTDIPIPFGTPLGSLVEQPLYPNLLPNLSIAGGNTWFGALANLVDNQGANITFLQALNLRFLRHAVYVSQIEVITPNTALGEQQRAENVRRIIIPLNSVNDACIKTGKFVPQFTEYTATTILDKEGIVLGDFHGFLYTMLAGSEASFNIYLQAIDTPCFKNV